MCNTRTAVAYIRFSGIGTLSNVLHGQVVQQRFSALSIEKVVIVFTDIVGSTDLYASLGDGAALQIVRQHFEVLFSAFAARGRVVKTVGDSVMASFTSGKAAIEAVAEALQNVAQNCYHPATGRPIEIRVGIHEGSTVVVPVNHINDYFGQTINVAARLEAAARASECVISNAVLDHTDAREAFDNIVGTDQGKTFIKIPKAKLLLKGIANPVAICGFRLIGCNIGRRSSDFMGSGSNSSLEYPIPRTTSRNDLADRESLKDDTGKTADFMDSANSAGDDDYYRLRLFR